MRALSSTLIKAQQAASRDPPPVKITLTYGATTHVFEEDRILEIKHPEDPYSQKAEVLLNDWDTFLDDLNLKGFKAVIANGLVTSAGAEYSDNAPLWVITQQFTSGPGLLLCTLNLEGILDLMARDEASESYSPEETDTKTVKTLLTQIITATLAAFNHCYAYQVVYDSEDSLIDSYKPKDSFRIRVGDTRLSKIKWLLDKTGCVARPQKDGKIHIFKPTTTGTSYDYEHSLEEGHTFFAKAYKERLIIPNYVVVKSQPDDDPQYSGFAKDDESYARLPKRKHFRLRLESNQQATDIAQAYIDKYKLGSDMGSAEIPMNVGAELFDYDKVTDERQGDSRVGNIGYIYRHYRGGDNPKFDMTFSFGNWFSVIRAQAALNQIMGLTDIGADFNRLWVKDLYAEHIWVDNVDFIWVDPEGNIDLSKIGDNLDNLADGELFARVKSLHLDAGQIKLDEHIYYKADYDPTTKFDPGHDTLDDIPEGITYQRAKSAALTADGLVILDQVVAGTYGLVKQTDISAGHILIDSLETIGETYGLIKQTDISAGHIRLDTTIPGTYGLVKSTDISAGHIILSTVEGDIDDLDEGTIYGRVRKTDISAGHIKLTVDQNLDAQGIEIVSSSSSTRIRINENRIAGYKAGVKQFELRASDGRAYCGGGAVVLDEDGIEIKGSHLRFTYGGLYGAYIYITSSGNLSFSPSTGYMLETTADFKTKNLQPDIHEARVCGYSNKAWSHVFGEYIYSSDGAIHSYQKHDDIALLKAIKTKKKKGKDVIDSKTLPKGLVDNGYVNIAGLAGLSIGIQKSLLAKIEALEATMGS